MPGARIIFGYNHGVQFTGIAQDGRRCFKVHHGYLLVPAGVTVFNNNQIDAVSWRYKPHKVDPIQRSPNCIAKHAKDVYEAYERLIHRAVGLGVQFKRTHVHNQFSGPPSHPINDEVYGVKLPKGIFADLSEYHGDGVAIQYYHPKDGNRHVGRGGTASTVKRLVTEAKHLRQQAYESFQRENDLSLEEALQIHPRKPKLGSSTHA